MKIGYARVSTQSQDTQLQLDALKDVGCQSIYEEKASGAKKDRLELESCLRALREGDVLVVWKLDRLGRSLSHLIDIVGDLESRGVGFLSVTENIDTTSSTGKLIFHIFCSLAEFERSLIRDRVNAGLEVARNKGRYGGRPNALSDKDKKMAVVMLNGGATKGEIAKQFGVARQTIYRFFKSEQDKLALG